MKKTAFLFCALAFAATYGAEVIECDLCVYGGTSSGVIAAVQAKRLGKKVVILEPGKHLGGLTSGGLGYTDIGNKAAIGGLSRDFYRRLGKHYGKDEAWTFEPGVAEREFEALVKEADVPVYFGHRLSTVTKEGTRLVELVLENGKVVRAKVFIDGSYEGDLMARAGVSYHVGRESNETYGETLNGICARTPKHQFVVPVDPYVQPGIAASGLLPLIQNTAFGEPGAGDKSVQAYNFRLCLTKQESNKKPIDPPMNYDPAMYELLGRYFDALAKSGKKTGLREFMKIDMVTADKTDINNNGGFSTDYIGMNHSYPDATYETRERLWKEHADYVRGFLTYLATSSRVPDEIRTEMREWGLCKDEFPETGGWPYQMYVREARRMISAYVMSEKNCRQAESVPDSVGLAAYNMDSHNCRRLVRDGRVENEGDVQVPPMKPYPIAYRSIVPKPAECENLFVPVCLAASHIAYGSIRMEPVFMILGQSCAIAGSMAIDEGLAVQKIDYALLRTKLLEAKQILDWSGTAPLGGMNPDQATANKSRAAKLDGIVVDDLEASKSEGWIESGNHGAERVGSGYIHDNNENKGAVSITYTPNLPRAGEYELILISPPHANRATNVPVSVVFQSAKAATVAVNQRTGSGFFSLGKFKLPPGKLTSVSVSNAGTDGYVVADGLQCVPLP